MLGLNFKKKYKVLHITNEIGNYVVGGMGTYINEMYMHRSEHIGFVHLYDEARYPDIEISNYPGTNDILTLRHDEYKRIEELDFEIIVIHFFELAFCITESLIQNKKIIYVIHSIPLPKPPPVNDPFGGHFDVRDKFEFLCNCANGIVCVSHADQERLGQLYPHFKSKTCVIHNGISLPNNILQNENYTKSRNILGFLGRLDYRKGILECIKSLKNTTAELRIACANNDPGYLNMLLDYIEAADMQTRVTFYGWCVGKRKENLLKSLDALIIPSLYEPFGYVVVEAIKNGLPIITSNSGGIGEIIGDYKYQFNPYKKDDMYHKILEFQNDANDVIQKEQVYLNERIKQFTAEIMVDKYMKLYESL